jgi:hypothetical protein
MGNNNLFGELLNSGENDNSQRKQRADVNIILTPASRHGIYKLDSFDRDTLCKMSMPFLKALSTVSWDVSSDIEGAKRVEFKSKLFAILQKISNSKKADYISFINDVVDEPKNVAQIVSIFPEQIKAALRILTVKRWAKIADYPELIRLYPKDTVIANEYARYASLFTTYVPFYGGRDSVGLNTYLMNVLSQCFLEDNPTMTTIEKPQTMFTFDAYPLLATEIPQIEWYFKNVSGINGTDFTATQLKDFAKKAHIKDFFTDKCMAIEYRRIRAVIMATFGYCMVKHTQLKPEYEENVLSALSKAVNCRIMKDVFYSNVNRPGRYSIYHEEFASEVITYISKNCSQGWYSPDDLVDAVLKGKQFSRHIANLFAAVDVQSRYISFYNEDTGQYIKSNNAIATVAVTLIYATAFVLAAVGLAEIAYDFPFTDQDSGYAGLKAFRLTPLGLHVFGYKSDYVHNEVDQEKMQLEDSALLIKVSSKDVVGFDFAKEISAKVSANLYKVTTETFLKNCAGKIGLLRRIQTFESLFGKDIPEIWKNFFAELNSKACLLENVTEDNYIVLQLKKDDAELMRILTENTVIRKISQRATGKIVLVKAKDYDKFCCELSKYGYLL